MNENLGKVYHSQQGCPCPPVFGGCWGRDACAPSVVSIHHQGRPLGIVETPPPLKREFFEIFKNFGLFFQRHYARFLNLMENSLMIMQYKKILVYLEVFVEICGLIQCFSEKKIDISSACLKRQRHIQCLSEKLPTNLMFVRKKFRHIYCSS